MGTSFLELSIFMEVNLFAIHFVLLYKFAKSAGKRDTMQTFARNLINPFANFVAHTILPPDILAN